MEFLDEEIDPPSDYTYGSYEEARDALKSHGAQHGYGIRLRYSYPYKTAFKTRYYYCCDKFGDHKSTATIRSTATRASGCPFKLVIFKSLDGWRLEVKQKCHNHLPSLHPSVHNAYRKRTPAQKDIIQSMTRAGAVPKQILTAIRQQDNDTLVTTQDIQNDRKSLRAQALGMRSPIEALLDSLSTPDWVFDVKKDSENRVQCLFFAHKKQVELLRANPDVLLMDCTYKTNKFGLPLLHILGCTNLQTFFSAGFCFLRNETYWDYHWAVSTFFQKAGPIQPRVFISDQENALKSAAKAVFPRVPQLLCVWHINKNVQTKAQQVWRDANGANPQEKKDIAQKRTQFMARWNQVVYAKTPEDFEQKWKKLLEDFKSQPELCTYMENNQYPIRFQWATAWTSQFRHYNTITTSPLEGMHKVLKDYLMTSRGDLLRVVERISDMVQNQYTKYQKELSLAKHSVKFHHRLDSMPFLPQEVHSFITPPAIESVRQQNLLLQRDQERGQYTVCSGRFEKVTGLPCRHTIQSVKFAGSALRMSHFDDDHWHYQRQQGEPISLPPRPYQNYFDPPNLQRRVGTQRNDSSTRREPSAFERPVPPSNAPRSVLTAPLGECSSQPEAGRMNISIKATTAPMSQAITVQITPSPNSTPPFSPVSVTVSVTVTPPRQSIQPAQSEEQPNLPPPPYTRLPSPDEISLSPSSPKPDWFPTLEDFLADIEHRRGQSDLPTLPTGRDVGAGLNMLWRHLKETGQENERMELVVAREDALATTGKWASASPEVVWSFHFGDQSAYWRWRNAVSRARHPFTVSSDGLGRRPKRAAAEKAPAAWKDLSPSKRQRRQ